MIFPLIAKEIIVIVAAALAAYTDWKTGFIYDRITYTLIAMGVIISAVELNFESFMIAAVVFVFGYLLYYTGKIGGGDVKLFVGISLVMPMVEGMPFIINALVYATMFAVVALSAYYVPKYIRRGIRWKEDFPKIILSIFVGVAFSFYVFFITQTGLLPFWFLGAISIVLIAGLVFLAFERGIRREFFLKNIKVKELEEDELVAIEFIDLKLKEKLGMKFKGVIDEKEKKRLLKMKIKEILVYRNLPKFGPFVLAGVVIAIIVGVPL